MRGDDRVMTILTGIALTVALGAVVQRSDLFSTPQTANLIEPRDDVAAFAPGGAALIDVIANDLGAATEDGRRLLITRAPACGAAWRHEGRVLYVSGPDCLGPQTLRYCVPRGDACPEAELRLTLDSALLVPQSASGTPVALLSEAPLLGPAAPLALAGAEFPHTGGFQVEGPPRAAPDRAPFAALGLGFGLPAERHEN